MGKKNARLEVVKMLISSQEISKQRELRDELGKAGYPCTQATLSRDLMQLKIVKAQNEEGRYVYMLPESRVLRAVSDTHMTVRALHNIGVLSVKFSGNLAVVRTLPGHASHVAYDIDNARIDSVMGTVAGDDTVLVILEEGTPRDLALNAISAVTNYNSDTYGNE